MAAVDGRNFLLTQPVVSHSLITQLGDLASPGADGKRARGKGVVTREGSAVGRQGGKDGPQGVNYVGDFLEMPLKCRCLHFHASFSPSLTGNKI